MNNTEKILILYEKHIKKIKRKDKMQIKNKDKESTIIMFKVRTLFLMSMLMLVKTMNNSSSLNKKITEKVVDNIDEAIAHINTYNTGHSEAIITKDYAHAQKFLNEIDAAAVYVNASTRFTDGFEFGFGAEIGISTQKIHARGPMGVKALTTSKYIIYGSGQVRS